MKKVLLGVVVGLVIAGAAFGTYWWLNRSTDHHLKVTVLGTRGDCHSAISDSYVAVLDAGKAFIASKGLDLSMECPKATSYNFNLPDQPRYTIEWRDRDGVQQTERVSRSYLANEHWHETLCPYAHCLSAP